MKANVTSFAQECRDAMTAVLDAVAAVGQERREHLAAAKFAVARALHEAHTAEEGSQLRYGTRWLASGDTILT